MYFSQKVDSQVHITDADLDAADEYIQRKRQRASEFVRDAMTSSDRVLQAGGSDRRVRRDTNATRRVRQELVDAKGLNPHQVAGLEWEVWHQRTLGKPVHKIAVDMGVPLAQVNLWLQDAMTQVQAKTQALIQLDKELELQRAETLLERYMPVALMDDVVVERIRQGEPVAERDLQVSQNCAYIVMELIKLRCKINGITMTQAQESLLPPVDVMGWLQTQKEFIQKTVKDAPKDVLTLEVETSIDETTEDIGATEGIQGAI